MNRSQPWDILDRYRGTAFMGRWPTLPELFRITAGRFPDRACFTVFDPERSSLTFAEALSRVEAVAARLVADGIRPGDIVALFGKNSPEWAMAYLGILFAGGVVAPIDYQLQNAETGNLVRFSGARALFVDVEKYDDFPPQAWGLIARYSLVPDLDGYLFAAGGKAAAKLPLRSETDLAAILFTSGTTGIPKGVMLTHLNLVSDAFLSQGNLPIFETDVFYALLPLHHSYTMLAVFIESIAVGAEIVFGRKMVTKQIFADLRAGRVTMFLGVPMLFNKLLAGIMKGIREKGLPVYAAIRLLMTVSGIVKKLTGINPGKRMFGTVLEKASLASIRICISGGGPLAPSVFRRYNELGLDFVQGYGLTETSPIIALNPTDAYVETSVGKVVPGAEIRIKDADARGVGEIQVRGPMVMQGYYRNDGATKEAFTPDGWLMTGDLGRMDSGSYLYLTGRAKNIIVTEGGKNVYPEEIENAFQLYPEVDQVLVRGYTEGAGEPVERIEALVYPSREFADAAGSPGAVKERVGKVVAEVNAKLRPFQRIERVDVLDEPLEMTTTKKIKRHVTDSGKPTGMAD